ncbi:MAG: hypothetical protein R2932_26025 [Caldilineaceae bacterium]
MITDGNIDTTALGGFDLAFTLPENINLGYANIYFSVRNVSGVYNTDYYYNFQIQEFRRPEFEVTARNEEKGPFFVGDDAVVAVSAQYFAGGPLPGAETTGMSTPRPAAIRPPAGRTLPLASGRRGGASPLMTMPTRQTLAMGIRGR